MHKNNYNPKTLNGNWHENRFTEEYNGEHDSSSNTYIQNPCKYPQCLNNTFNGFSIYSLQQVCANLQGNRKPAKLRKGKYMQQPLQTWSI